MAKLECLLSYVALTLVQLFLAGLLVIVQSVVNYLSPVVFVVYQQLLSAVVLTLLSLFFDWGKRPQLSLEIISYIFVVAILQTPIGSLLLTLSLRYTTATFQSVALNTVPVLVFVLAVILRQEPFRFWGIHGQAKLWGIIVSGIGATVMVFLVARDSGAITVANGGGPLVGIMTTGISVLASAMATVLLERVALKYPADLTLSAMLAAFGTLQCALVGVFTERDISSWIISWNSSKQLLAILYTGIIINGVILFVRIWCIHKRGPVFVVAFSPLLVVFSFLLQTILWGAPAEFGSILGVVLVIGGLYLLLWAKSADYKMQKIDNNIQTHYPIDISSNEPLLPK